MPFSPSRVAMAAVPLLFLAACGGDTMSAASGGDDMEIRRIDLNQCDDWDWRSQGEEDAKRGIPAEKALASYTSDCEQRSDGPDTEAYMVGYDSAK